MARTSSAKTSEKAPRYRKATIPQEVRRQVARRYGCPPGETIEVPCHYCGALGHIAWQRLSSGRPGAWVHFGHELDHRIPEFYGGPTTADNIVLACPSCNRRKGTRIL